MRFLTTFLFLCLLVLLSLFSHSVVSADSYDPNLSKSLLHLAGAAYCHPSWLAKWSCSFCKEEPNFQVHKVVDNGVTIMQTIVGVLNNNTIVVSFKGTGKGDKLTNKPTKTNIKTKTDRKTTQRK